MEGWKRDIVAALLSVSLIRIKYRIPGDLLCILQRTCGYTVTAYPKEPNWDISGQSSTAAIEDAKLYYNVDRWTQSIYTSTYHFKSTARFFPLPLRRTVGIMKGSIDAEILPELHHSQAWARSAVAGLGDTDSDSWYMMDHILHASSIIIPQRWHIT
jgi:hypothetical protein